jgi:hypothetical protein
MTAKMTKVPSYLKGLAETRARAAGDLQRINRLAERLDFRCEEMQDEMKRLDLELEQSILVRASLTSRREKAIADLGACDLLIKKFDARLKPEDILPIEAWKGRYGKRGSLTKIVLGYLKALHPKSVSSFELALAIPPELSMPPMTRIELEEWVSNSLRPCLRDLVKTGRVTRERVGGQGPGNHTYWLFRSDRLNSPDYSATGEVDRPRSTATLGPSLDHLKARAAAQGVSVRSSNDDHE